MSFLLIFASILLKMRVIKEAIKNILLAGILVSFLLSTSGFVVTRHICKHHPTEIVLGEVTDGCCEMEKTEAPKTSCCSSQKASVKQDSKGCCQFEKNYIRLSENFISSEKPDFSNDIQVMANCNLKEIIPSSDEILFSVKESKNPSLENTPKVRAHILFHQVKVEPPLI
jgi:hypothetical protein